MRAVETFSTQELCDLTGATYRMVDYWCRLGTLPCAHEARGQGTKRRFTRAQVVTARVLVVLAGLGAEAPVLRSVAESMQSTRWPAMVVVGADGTLYGLPDAELAGGGWFVDVDAARRHVDTMLAAA